MTRRIWVNSGRLNRGRKTERTDGIELTVEVSPYSLPKTVVGRYDRESGRFVIEFKYIDKENPSSKPLDLHGVVITEGRHSRKILSISIPVDHPPNEGVSVISLKTRIADAFRERIRDVTDPDAPGAPDVLNQEVADEILDAENLGELIGNAG